MAAAKRPGIKKPARDERGRFAPKVGTDVPKSGREAFEERFKAQEPHWLKRFRRWLGKKLFRAAIVVYGF